MMFVTKSLTLSILSAVSLCGCTARTEISIVRISDPDGGVSMDIPVQRDGTFSQETKNDEVVCVASGKISKDAVDVHAVELKYDRRRYSAPGKSKSEELKVTLKAKADVEVPIGKNPSKLAAEQSVVDNALTNVTLKLLKGG